MTTSPASHMVARTEVVIFRASITQRDAMSAAVRNMRRRRRSLRMPLLNATLSLAPTGIQVLIIHRDRSSALDWQLHLAAGGITAVWADTTPRAREVLDQDVVHLVLADRRSWDAMGPDIMERMRADGRHAPVLLRDDDTPLEALATAHAEDGAHPVRLRLPNLQVATAEWELIRQALARTNQQRAAAAQLLGIHPRTLRRKLAQADKVRSVATALR